VATTSGDVTIDAALDAATSHSITSVSGDVRLITGSEVTVELQSVAGDIRASMPHRVDGARGRRTIVVGSGRVKVGIKTMSGDVKLKPGEPDLAPGAIGAPGDAGGAPKASFWTDFSRDWAESAKDWASWGAQWAAGKAWATSSSGASWTTPPQAPAAPKAPVAPTPPAAPEAPVAPAPSVAATAPDEPATATHDAETALTAREGAAAPAPLEDTAPVPIPTHADLEAARLEILRSLERGDLDVATAADRLAALEAVGHEEA